ncbi:ABC transporter permease [Streptomyces sp. HPF1205]|uniref:ABC transporter permease n=1 Tax=Streptomyces sp. HPF1205 TaxID=2873262 RepID=UPI001CEC9AA2|nr:ABC transporter permease [Streptomyces sp. HPF1205]
MRTPHDVREAAGSGSRPGPAVSPRGWTRDWARDLGLGLRFAAGGGREGWVRTLLTAVGVGLGVALLLLASAVPAMMNTRDGKRVARDYSSTGYLARPTDSTLLAADATTTFHDKTVLGTLFQPEGPQAPHPPGTRALPAPGHMLVSPALKKLLATSPLLRERLPYTVSGTIGKAGLMGPAELYFYAGVTDLTARDADYRHGNADRIAGFGHHSNSQVMGPTFDLLLVVVVVVLLLPVAVFSGTAVRLGGERRDRRLAALRLVGADMGAVRRIAVGEALFGAVLGLLLGGVFFLAGRELAGRIDLGALVEGISFYPSDMTPGTALTLLVALAVPAAAVAVTVLSLRGTAVEPLGVERQGLPRRRRLWWRLTAPALGLALLAPLFGTVKADATLNEYQAAAGVVLLLAGVTAILPWAVERAVGHLRGGPVAWQLAVRRLQLSSGASARMVNGVTVAVAGAIALQMLFGAVGGRFSAATGEDTSRAQAALYADVTGGGQARSYFAAVAGTPGVTRVYGHVDGLATQPDAARLRGAPDYARLPVQIGDCPALRQMARITACGPGSVFLVPPTGQMEDPTTTSWMRQYVRPGGHLDLNVPVSDSYTGTPKPWTIPPAARTAVARADPEGMTDWGVLATPQALDAGRLTAPSARVLAVLDPHRPDAIEYLRNTGARLGPGVNVQSLRDTTTLGGYVQLRRGLFAGAAVTMALLGVSLLVSVLEQLRERKKMLAVLVAFGTRRSALAWSVLWQAAVPVALGLALACAGGLGLGAVLLAMVGEPFHADWASVATMCCIGGGVVLAVTLLSLPPLWRLMRPDGLRTE